MILLNLAPWSEYSFSNNWTKRIHAAAQAHKRTVRIYPDDYPPCYDGYDALATKQEFLQRSIEFLDGYCGRIDRVIFLDFSLAGPQLQETEREFDYEIFVHVSRDYRPYHYGNMGFMDTHDGFKRIITGNAHAYETYANCQGRAIGGFIKAFSPEPKEDYVLYSGVRDDTVKGIEEFYELAQLTPDVNFVCCNPRDFSGLKNVVNHGVLPEHEYKEVIKKARYVLSTARCETFGYALMDAVRYGAIPLVPDIPCYKEFFPEKFRYKVLPNFMLAATLQELEAIVAPHFYLDTFKRLIASPNHVKAHISRPF